MSIQNFSLQDSPTGFTVTAGTAKTFSVDGVAIANGIHTQDAANTDFKSRITITFRARLPQRNSNGTYSKGHNYITVLVPYVKTDGTVDTSVHQYHSDYTVDIPAANVLNGRRLLTQCLFDAELETFHTSGTLA